MTEHAEIGTVITDEKALRLFRMTPVGHLRTWVNQIDVSTTIFYPADSCYVTHDNSPYYIGVMDGKYSVYVGIDRDHDYNIVFNKSINPETYDVGIAYEKDTCGDPWEMNGIFLIPVLKRKETMQW